MPQSSSQPKTRSPRGTGPTSPRSSTKTRRQFQKSSAAPALDADLSVALQERLLHWYRTTRRDLPWRRTSDPYAVWLSEVMLQQTRVETVIPYYERFLEDFPTVHALAEAPLDAVLARWSGLGYYRRARLLHAAAREIVADHGGVLPRTAEGLRSLTGIGAYTAGAVASIAYGERAPLVDGNVARVLARLFALEEDVRTGPGLARVWSLAAELVPADAPGDFNQALMELGATVCVPRDPRCLLCPVQELCEAKRRGLEHALPVLKPKAEPVPTARVALVVRQGEGVWLAQRRTDGPFGGMWEPPSIVRETPHDGDDAREEDLGALVELVGLDAEELGAVRSCGVVVHVLSHRRLSVLVLEVSVGAGARPRLRGDAPEYMRLEAVDPSAASDRALTTYARKVLAKAKVF